MYESFYFIFSDGPKKWYTSKWHEMESGIPRKYYTITQKGTDQIKLMNDYFGEIQASIKRISDH
jgi:PadR family transcriptional regulator PadR